MDPVSEIRTYDRYNVVSVSLLGNVSLYKLASVLNNLFCPNGATRFMNAVVDLRNARIQAETVEIQQLGERCQFGIVAHEYRVRTAVVCADDYSFGIFRMIAVELERTPIHIKVVKTMDDALTWALETEYLFDDYRTA